MSFEGLAMLGGMSLTVVKKIVPCFQRIYVMPGSLRDMLDDLKNLINRQLQEGED